MNDTLPPRPLRTAGQPSEVFSEASLRATYGPRMALVKVGDRYSYRIWQLGEDTRDFNQRVTSIGANEVHLNRGRIVLDPLGNIIKTGDGRRFSPRQDVPLEYAVGKRWATRFELLEGGQGSVEAHFRITARERVTVPAGTFDCFRIEARGLSTHVFRPPVESKSVIWRAPQLVRRWVKFEDEWHQRGSLIRTERQELLSFQQS